MDANTIAHFNGGEFLVSYPNVDGAALYQEEIGNIRGRVVHGGICGVTHCLS